MTAFIPAIHIATKNRRQNPLLQDNISTQPATRQRHIITAKKRDGSFPSQPGAKHYKVRVNDPKKGIVHEYEVPEDRYIWHSMFDAGADIPSSCRNGCCTTCAVKLKSGNVDQEEALGLLREMKDKRYALLCVSFPESDIECELQDEDEVYVKQFGSTFESGGVEWGGVLPEEE